MRRFDITLSQLQFHARHGVFDQEQTVGNDFTVDLTVSIPCKETLSSQTQENLGDTISYADLYEIVKEEMSRPRQLLETVATAIADRIQALWPQVQDGSVTICKTTPPIPGITGAAKITLHF